MPRAGAGRQAVGRAQRQQLRHARCRIRLPATSRGGCTAASSTTRPGSGTGTWWASTRSASRPTTRTRTRPSPSRSRWPPTSAPKPGWTTARSTSCRGNAITAFGLERFDQRMSATADAVDADLGGEVRLGSALFTLVEPHRGHEVAYNRWYERDHFYAGCMIGPWYRGRRRCAPASSRTCAWVGQPAVRRRPGRVVPRAVLDAQGPLPTTRTGRPARSTGCTATGACSPSATTSTRCSTSTTA